MTSPVAQVASRVAVDQAAGMQWNRRECELPSPPLMGSCEIGRELADKSRTNGLPRPPAGARLPHLTWAFAPNQLCRRGDLNPHALSGTSPSKKPAAISALPVECLRVSSSASTRTFGHLAGNCPALDGTQRHCLDEAFRRRFVDAVGRPAPGDAEVDELAHGLMAVNASVSPCAEGARHHR